MRFLYIIVTAGKVCVTLEYTCTSVKKTIVLCLGCDTWTCQKVSPMGLTIGAYWYPHRENRVSIRIKHPIRDNIVDHDPLALVEQTHLLKNIFPHCYWDHTLLKKIKGTWSAPSLVCGHSQVQLLEDMHNCTSLKSLMFNKQLTILAMSLTQPWHLFKG